MIMNRFLLSHKQGIVSKKYVRIGGDFDIYVCTLVKSISTNSSPENTKLCIENGAISHMETMNGN